MILLIVAVLIVFFYFYTIKNHDYWAKRNVKHVTPVPLFGNRLQNLLGNMSNTQVSLELYHKYPGEKVVGFYECTTPGLLIRDPEIIRRILSVDFAFFYRRGLALNTTKQPLSRNLFNVDGDLWKLLRQRLTPTFTTSKLKNMFPLVVKCADKMQTVIENIAAKDGTCDVRELMARFTTEFIGACGFGIEMDTINDEKSLFRELGKKIFSRSLRTQVMFGLTQVFPMLRRYVRVGDINIEIMITQIVKQIHDQRNGKPIGRNDFIDLLLELEGKGKMVGESIEKTNSDGTPTQVEAEMDLSLMAAQVFIFFAAGFETSSFTTSMTLHLLAYHTEIQNEIQEQIDDVYQKYDNKLCYDAVAEMTKLDNALKESMRIIPSLGVLNRECAKRYTIPELDITIDPGVKIVIPIQAMQNDEKYFDDPEEFRPERFANHKGKEQHQYIYMPFGRGPRACIGERLGQMQSLAGLAALLHKFSVEPAPTTVRYPKIDPRINIVQSVKGGVPLKLKPRKLSPM